MSGNLFGSGLLGAVNLCRMVSPRYASKQTLLSVPLQDCRHCSVCSLGSAPGTQKLEEVTSRTVPIVSSGGDTKEVRFLSGKISCNIFRKDRDIFAFLSYIFISINLPKRKLCPVQTVSLTD